MSARRISDRVFWVGALDWDRRLFDSLVPLPDGTTYNAYVIRGSQATALIDTVDPTMTHVLQENLTSLDVGKLDYIICNHAEQDHSGSLPDILARFPSAKVVCTPRCAELLSLLLHIPGDRLVTVQDGETLSLGDLTLEFIHAPWVHWPETMLTYLREESTLFPCDLFGSHLAASELSALESPQLGEAIKRYYAEIMMPFARNIAKHLERLGNYEIARICPSHGPIYDRPEYVLALYREWVLAEPKNLATIAYVTMHGSTRMLTDHLVAALIARGVGVERFDLVGVDIGRLAMSLVDAATVLIGTPTVLAGPHPSAVYAAHLVNALRPKAKFVGVYGSYGWGTRADEQLAAQLTNLRPQVLDSVLVKGMPRSEDYAAIDRLADTIASKHAEAGLKSRTPESRS